MTTKQSRSRDVLIAAGLAVIATVVGFAIPALQSTDGFRDSASDSSTRELTPEVALARLRYIDLRQAIDDSETDLKRLTELIQDWQRTAKPLEPEIRAAGYEYPDSFPKQTALDNLRAELSILREPVEAGIAGTPAELPPKELGEEIERISKRIADSSSPFRTAIDSARGYRESQADRVADQRRQERRLARSEELLADGQHDQALDVLLQLLSDATLSEPATEKVAVLFDQGISSSPAWPQRHTITAIRGLTDPHERVIAAYMLAHSFDVIGDEAGFARTLTNIRTYIQRQDDGKLYANLLIWMIGLLLDDGHPDDAFEFMELCEAGIQQSGMGAYCYSHLAGAALRLERDDLWESYTRQIRRHWGGSRAAQTDIARAYAIGGQPEDGWSIILNMKRGLKWNYPFTASICLHAAQLGNREIYRQSRIELLKEFSLHPSGSTAWAQSCVVHADCFLEDFARAQSIAARMPPGRDRITAYAMLTRHLASHGRIIEAVEAYRHCKPGPAAAIGAYNIVKAKSRAGDEPSRCVVTLVRQRSPVIVMASLIGLYVASYPEHQKSYGKLQTPDAEPVD